MSWTIRISDGICVSIQPHLKIFCLFKNSLNSPNALSDCSVITLGCAENGWIGILSSSIFPITGRLKALQRGSGPVSSQDCFLDCNLTASKNVTFLLLRCTANHLSHTCFGIVTSSVVKLCWPSLHSWVSPLALPVSWCQCDIIDLKSLMWSSEHKATLPDFQPIVKKQQHTLLAKLSDDRLSNNVCCIHSKQTLSLLSIISFVRISVVHL